MEHYIDLADTSCKVHAELFNIRERFTEAANTLKEMLKLVDLMKVALGDRLVGLDTDADLVKRLNSLNLTDERFIMKLGRVLSKADGVERLDLLVTIACDIGLLIKNCEEKMKKMDERLKLMPRWLDDQHKEANPEWTVTNSKRRENFATVKKLKLKLDFIQRKFFSTRKQVLNRVLGATELFEGAVVNQGQVISQRHLDRNKLDTVAEGFTHMENKMRKEAK